MDLGSSSGRQIGSLNPLVFQKRLLPWCCSLPLFPDLLLSGSQSGLLTRALVRVLQLCVGVRLTLNTDLSSYRPCIGCPPIDFGGELFFGPASSARHQATRNRRGSDASRAPRKIALFDCAHWMRERHAGLVARDRNGSAWLFRP